MQEIHHNSLPEPTTWSDRPIFIQPINGTSLIGTDRVLLGEPTPFESPLFKGKCLFRLRSVKSNLNQKAQDAYFSHPNNRKMVIQIAVQGRFKESIPMSDVYTGEEFERPLRRPPPKIIGKLLQKVFCALIPGVKIDIYAAQPRVLCRIGGGCHSISIDDPGNEPDLAGPDLPEKTMFGSGIRNSSKRKRLLSRDKQDPENCFSPDLVYTFNNSDEFLDLGNYNVRLPLGNNLNLVNIIGSDAIGINVLTSGGRNIYAFKIWHEKLLDEAILNK